MPNGALIVGFGAAGRSLAADAGRQGIRVAGFLDDHAEDDLVLGTLSDAARVIAEVRPEIVYIAIPSLSGARLRKLVSAIPRETVVATLTRTYDTISREEMTLDDLTDLGVLELVGRAPVKADLRSAAEHLRDRRVLVTGAAGSIGGRLVRMLGGLPVESVVGVDHREGGIHELETRFGDDRRMTFVLDDVTHESSFSRLVAAARPDVILHAAAFKHVPLLETRPGAAVLNNVGGTLAVLRVAAEAGVDGVYISTDKAVEPLSVMGATKRVGELLVDSFATGTDGGFRTVRFGNVIESSGSVMEIFRRQLREGVPLTVTDPDMERYFMTLDEASQLILHALIVGRPGDVLVLDMGEPVKIVDLAEALIARFAPELTVEYSGVRAGERLTERLVDPTDALHPTAHPHIGATTVRRGPFRGAELLARVDELLRDLRDTPIAPEDVRRRLDDLARVP